MIYFTKEIKQQILKESERCYPNECCGILFGRLGENSDKHVESISPVDNSSDEEEAFHRFLITPEIMRKAELEARKRKIDIVGFYHSHPNKPAIASEYDRAHALPVYSYIITSVTLGIAIDIKSYELSLEGEVPVFEDELIVIENKHNF
ncbi:MAG: M67 family metallopeptidase [Clostridiales bacterium]|nr:M67 family metallopeptidase [Clostridiales bacterium]